MGIFIDAIRERRSSEMDLVTNPSAFFASLFGDISNDSGVTVNAKTAMTYSPVLACIRILSESVAQVPWNVMRKSTDGKSSDVATETIEHRLLHRSPNPRQSSFSFRSALVANAALHGNGFAELVWNLAGKLDTVRFIPSANVTIAESKMTDELFYDIKRADGTTDRKNMDDMIHIPTLSVDGVTGLSMIAQFNQGIGIGLAAEKFGASFLGKGARPAGALYSDLPMDDKQQKQAGESWQSAYGGAGNAGKTPVLSGLKWVPLSSNMVDSQYQEIREFQVAECARVFRIPGVFLGMKETSTFASAEAFFLSFVKFTIAPWAELIEQEFDRKLFPKDLNMYTHLDLRGLMRGDAASRVAYYKGMFDIGAMESNEARCEEDMNPTEGGDRTFVQQNLMPVDMVDEVLKAKAAKPAPAVDPNAEPKSDPKMDPQMKSIHRDWLASVVVRMRGWQNFEKPKAVAALEPVFRSWAGEKKFDVDALCRQLADEKLDEGFVTRAVARFEEAINEA